MNYSLGPQFKVGNKAVTVEIYAFPRHHNWGTLSEKKSIEFDQDAKLVGITTRIPHFTTLSVNFDVPDKWGTPVFVLRDISTGEWYNHFDNTGNLSHDSIYSV